MYDWVEDWDFNTSFFNYEWFPELATGWYGKWYGNIYLEFFNY